MNWFIKSSFYLSILAAGAYGSSVQADPGVITETVVVVVEKVAQETTASNIGLAAQYLCDATYNIGCGMVTIGKVCCRALPSPITLSRGVLQVAKLCQSGSQVLSEHPIVLAGLVGFGAGIYVCKSDILNQIKTTLPTKVKRVTLRVVDTSGRLVGWAIGTVS